MTGTVVTDYWDTRAHRTLEIVEDSSFPQEVTLRVVGAHGGIHGLVTMDRRAAANLGKALVEMYGEASSTVDKSH